MQDYFLVHRKKKINIFKSKISPIKSPNKISAPKPAPELAPDTAKEPGPEAALDPRVFDSPKPTKAKKKTRHKTSPSKLR